MLHRRKPLASDGHFWLLDDNDLGSRLRALEVRGIRAPRCGRTAGGPRKITSRSGPGELVTCPFVRGIPWIFFLISAPLGPRACGPHETQCPFSTCAVTRRRFSSGCKPHPATAPAGSDRSRHGGDEVSEAFGERSRYTVTVRVCRPQRE